MTSDAHHFVAPHLETVTRCIAECIEDAGISPRDIDAVNAHATSTKVGDKVEYDALKAVFGGAMPPVSANKSLIGHAMGASSAIESIFAMEGMLNGVVLPTINYTPDPEMVLDCVAEGARLLDQEYVLKEFLWLWRLQLLHCFSQDCVRKDESSKKQKGFCGRIRRRHAAGQNL